MVNQAQFFFTGPRAHFSALLAVILAAAVLRVLHFSGYSGLDDAEYSRIAYEVAHGNTLALKEYSGPPVFPLRVGLILPVGLAFRAFGLSEWSMVMYPLLLSILMLPLAYACAWSVFGHRAGFVAVALLALVPMELGSATQLVPDMPAAFYAALGVTVIILAGRAGAERRSALFWCGVLAGASFGLSWLCKEAISFLVPFALAYMAISLKQNARTALALWSGVAVGSLGILLGEMIIYQGLAGDALFRFHEIERNYRQLENGFFTKGSDFGWREGESYARAVAKRLFISGPAMLLLNFEFLFLPLVGVVAAFHAWYSKDRSFLVPSLWLVTLLLMFNFSSSSASSYMPVALFERYFYLIIFPSAILVSGFVVKLMFGSADPVQSEVQRERRFWGSLLAVALFVMGGYLTQAALKTRPSEWASEVRILASTIEPSSLLYTDTLSIRGLKFFSGYPKETKWTDFASTGSVDEIPRGSLVLVKKAYIDWLNKNAGMWLSPRSGYRKHDFYDNPPGSWKEIWRERNARLYRVE